MVQGMCSIEIMMPFERWWQKGWLESFGWELWWLLCGKASLMETKFVRHHIIIKLQCHEISAAKDIIIMGPSPYSMFEECFRVFLSSHILFVLLLLFKKNTLKQTTTSPESRPGRNPTHNILYNIHTNWTIILKSISCNEMMDDFFFFGWIYLDDKVSNTWFLWKETPQAFLGGMNRHTKSLI